MKRLLAVADTDSYLKWAAATLTAMPPEWRSTIVVIDNPAMPSPAQIASATHMPTKVLDRRAILRRIRNEAPDVVLLACTGPVVAALADSQALRRRSRPVLVTGLPGISVPATARAVALRRGCDLFVLHSHRERAEFAALGRTMAPHLRIGLATLPFLRSAALRQDGDGRPRTELVFAAQAKVPPERADREAILIGLAAAGSAIVKLRAANGEQQTHQEAWPYPDLMADLVEQGRIEDGSIRFVTGPMPEALQSARGFVTVSSTAALEALAAGVPTLILSDFGVSAEMINIVFEGSGCIGTLADAAAGRFPRPNPDWLAADYFHPASDNDWLDELEQFCAVRVAGPLPRRPRATGPLRARVRRRIRLLMPARLLRRYRAVARLLAPARAAAPRELVRPVPVWHHDRPGAQEPAERAVGSPAVHRPPQLASSPTPSARDH
jgi:hypothetical protein